MRPHPLELPDRIGDVRKRRAWLRIAICDTGAYDMRWRVGDRSVGSKFVFNEHHSRFEIAQILLANRDQMREFINREKETQA